MGKPLLLRWTFRRPNAAEDKELRRRSPFPRSDRYEFYWMIREVDDMPVRFQRLKDLRKEAPLT